MNFAALVRVSTESQERQGESLTTQRNQIIESVTRLKSNPDDITWYGGQEHATSDYERRELDRLIQDAELNRFEAVMVTDVSRWSRDNGKSKQYLSILRKHNIRFFVQTFEYSLYSPENLLFLGMSVEIGEFHANMQSLKSIQNRYERAKANNVPTCGKLPFARTFDKKSKTWGIDPEKHKIVKEIADLYLTHDVSWVDIGRKFKMNPSNVAKIMKFRCGDTWEQEFILRKANFHELVITKVPRLLPEETIHEIIKKSSDRKTWDKGSRKHDYLLAKMIFDAETKLALTGTTNDRGVRYYKPFQDFRDKKKLRYQINADALEQAVISSLFHALCSNAGLEQAVFNGNLRKTIKDINKQIELLYDKKATIAKKLRNYKNAIALSDDVGTLFKLIKTDVESLELDLKAVNDEITVHKQRLMTIPDPDNLEKRRLFIVKSLRDKLKAGLKSEIQSSFLESGQAFYRLSFAEKRKILKVIFGGRDELGNRYGIYVTIISRKPRIYKFEAIGRLGNLEGCLQRGQETVTDSQLRPNPQITKELSQIILAEHPGLSQEIEKDKPQATWY